MLQINSFTIISLQYYVKEMYHLFIEAGCMYEIMNDITLLYKWKQLDQQQIIYCCYQISDNFTQLDNKTIFCASMLGQCK
jgi:hypothetical protein